MMRPSWRYGWARSDVQPGEAVKEGDFHQPLWTFFGNGWCGDCGPTLSLGLCIKRRGFWLTIASSQQQPTPDNIPLQSLGHASIKVSTLSYVCHNLKSCRDVVHFFVNSLFHSLAANFRYICDTYSDVGTDIAAYGRRQIYNLLIT